MFSKSIVAFALLASSVAAQNTTINPNSVDASTRSSWCSGELSTCGILCSGNTDSNTCDPTSLNYTCACSSNSSTPGLQYYTQSMPTFICEQIYANCIAAGQNVAAAQKVCTTNEQNNCGHLDPANFTAAAASSTASSTASATGSSAATGSAATTSATKGAAAALGRDFSTGIVAAGIAGVFGFML
jgi:hypothetical protein